MRETFLVPRKARAVPRRLRFLAPLFLFPLPALPQHTSPQFTLDEISFDQWVAQGEINQIPWSLQLKRPRLRDDQRIGMVVTASVSGKQLRRLGPQQDLVLVLRLARRDGSWLPGYGWLAQQLDQPLPRRTDLDFHIELLITPGQYRLAIVLLDRIHHKRSVALRTLRIVPLPDDPLPQANRGLPPVEFVPKAQGLDAIYQPDVAGRLWLPLETRRPLHIELLVNFSVSEERRRRGQERFNRAALLSSLKAFSQIALANGSLRVTALDIVRREVLFEQENVRELDWPLLREALQRTSSGVISAQALSSRKQNAAFFRNVLAERLQATAENSSALAAGDGPALRPHRVFVILSSAMLFTRGADLHPLPAPAQCDCTFYYLRFRISGELWDQLQDVMKRLEPRRFDVAAPLDFRKALAKILADLRQL